MNKKQKEDLAKFFYDVAKLNFAGLVLASALNGGSPWAVVFGGFATLGCVLVAVWLERG